MEETVCLPQMTQTMRNISYLFLAVFAWSAICAHAQNGTGGQTLRLARFPKSANQYVASQMVEVICKKSGLEVKIEPLPPKRATIEAKAGRINGEVSRIENYFLENPDLIRVSPAYSYIVITAFSKKPISIKSKDDLSNYKIGIVRGVQTSIDLTAGLSGVEEANNSEALFAMLAQDRFDVAIDVNVNGMFAIHKLGISTAKDVGTLLKTEVFFVLSPVSASLADGISQTIVQMKRSGELDRLKTKL
jgi:polar amino acid transport system substrate-binding protein